MLTLSSIQTSSGQAASGYCSGSQDFIDLVNELIPRLANRGDWPGFELPVRVVVRNGNVTWPRSVSQVRKINGCRGNIPMHSVWHEFLEYRGSRHIHSWQGWLHGEHKMTYQFNSCTYNDLDGTPSTVRVIPLQAADIGVPITIFGTDQYNQPLITQNPTGQIQLGLTIDAQLPYAETPIINSIQRVVKGVSQGNIMLYGFNQAQQALYDLACYEPSEINPSYVRYKLDGHWPNNGGSTCCGHQTVVALVKLKFIPVTLPTDGLIFLDGAEGALYAGLRALKREQSGDGAGAKGYWAQAIEELNRQLEDYNPQENFPAQNNVLGVHTFSNRTF
jgi:hypothetical protein